MATNEKFDQELIEKLNKFTIPITWTDARYAYVPDKCIISSIDKPAFYPLAGKMDIRINFYPIDDTEHEHCTLLDNNCLSFRTSSQEEQDTLNACCILSDEQFTRLFDMPDYIYSSVKAKQVGIDRVAARIFSEAYLSTFENKYQVKPSEIENGFLVKATKKGIKALALSGLFSNHTICKIAIKLSPVFVYPSGLEKEMLHEITSDRNFHKEQIAYRKEHGISAGMGK